MICILTRADLMDDFKNTETPDVRQWMFKKYAIKASAASDNTYFFGSCGEGILLTERTTDSIISDIRTKLRVPSLRVNL